MSDSSLICCCSALLNTALRSLRAGVRPGAVAGATGVCGVIAWVAQGWPTCMA